FELAGLEDLAFQLLLPGDVAQDQHRADRGALAVAERRGGVGDDAFDPVAGDEDAALTHGVPSPISFMESADRIQRPAILLAEDGKDLGERSTDRVGLVAATALLGDGVEQGDSAVGVGCDDTVGDGPERYEESFALSGKSLLNAGAFDEGGDDARDARDEARQPVGRVDGRGVPERDRAN